MLENLPSARFKLTTRVAIVLAAATLGVVGAASGCNRNKVETIPETVIRPGADAP
jgi:hypothetical protein